jgi:hypothetical protein
MNKLLQNKGIKVRIYELKQKKRIKKEYKQTKNK